MSGLEAVRGNPAYAATYRATPMKSYTHDFLTYTSLFTQTMACNDHFLEYHLGARCFILLNSAALLVEAAAYTCLHLLAALVETVVAKAEVIQFRLESSAQRRFSTSLAYDCLTSLVSPVTLTKKLARYGSLSPEIRENRLIPDDAEVQRKLAKEYALAQADIAAETTKNFCLTTEELTEEFESFEKPVGPFSVGVFSMQGRRRTMQDKHILSETVLQIAQHSYPLQLFAVLDGHGEDRGGDATAIFLEQNLQPTLLRNLQFFNPTQLTEKGIFNALKRTFVDLNHEWKELCKTHRSTAGSTACVVMILDEKVWTANVGDTRAIATTPTGAIQLSQDAKPGNDRYKQSVLNRQGRIVTLWGNPPRVDAILAVARAVGDVHVKGVSARPKITCTPIATITPGHQIIIACDGLFDVASTLEISNRVTGSIVEKPQEIAKMLGNSAYVMGSRDNISVIVIKKA